MKKRTKPSRRRNPFAEFVSLRELAAQLGMKPATLHYYLKCVGVRPLAAAPGVTSARFVRADDVVSIINSIENYKTRRVPGLSAEEAALELGLQLSTIRSLVSQKRLKAKRIRGRLSFTREEITRYGRGRRRRLVA